MKKTTRILSLLLAAVMIFALMAIGASAAETLTPLTKEESFKGIPKDAGNVSWLSDLYSTEAMKYSFVIGKNNSTAEPRAFSCDKNFFGNRVFIYTDGSEYREVSTSGGKVDGDGNRALSNGITYNVADIVLGAWGTKFLKGLGFQPSGTGSSNPATVVYDVSNLDVDTFYAVAGITGRGNEATNQEVLLTFEVHGSKESADSGFELLASVENIRHYLTGEFNVNIAGYKYIKLVCVSTGSGVSLAESAWGAACVYKAGAGTGVESQYNPGAGSGASSEDATPTDNYAPNLDGVYIGVPSKYSKSATYLSRMLYVDSSNTPSTDAPNGKPTCVNYPYNAPNELITMGAAETIFYKGLGMHPKDPKVPVNDTIESWTTYDISMKNCDRFYSVVGITNAAGREGASQGVIFRVYGDYEGNGEYTLLGQSELITKNMTGEFDIDITGVKVLRLAVVAGGRSHSASACAFGNAAIYSTTGATETPNETKPPIIIPSHRDENADNNAEKAAVPVGLIIGIAAGVLVVAGVVVFIIIKKKNTKKDA